MTGAAEEFYPRLKRYVEERIGEFDQISDDRKSQLTKLADYVDTRLANGQPIRMTFICTHNSRRSHLAQLWSAVAAEHYGIETFESYSGGTEATAFNPRAVAALKRVGMEIDIEHRPENPLYLVTFSSDAEPQTCFSKVYNEVPNPKSGFCAVMTCSDADMNCPLVDGADLRIAIPYEDPKVADGTPAESARYDERCAQIAREMLFLFSQVGR